MVHGLETIQAMNEQATQTQGNELERLRQQVAELENCCAVFLVMLGELNGRELVDKKDISKISEITDTPYKVFMAVVNR